MVCKNRKWISNERIRGPCRCRLSHANKEILCQKRKKKRNFLDLARIICRGEGIEPPTTTHHPLPLVNAMQADGPIPPSKKHAPHKYA